MSDIQAKFSIKNPASAVSYGAVHSLGTGESYFSDTWDHNYDTGAAWTWAQVDAINCGVALRYLGGASPLTKPCRCPHLYLMVNYVAQVNPQIRTTMMYALVNYTPSTGVCNLHQPLRYHISNSRKVSIVQPERGDRVVYDLCRESKTLTLEGIEYNTDTSTATTRLMCVKNQKDNGAYITISGVGDAKVDTTWLITDFTYSRDERNQYIWNWTLTAEKYESG